MKHVMISALLAALVTLYFSTAAQADSRDSDVNARQHLQHQRIERGMRSGELTRGEARRLGHEQRAIRAEERRYRADGHFSRAERADLHHDLNRASRHVYNEKHDGQVRGRPVPVSLRDPGVNARQENQRRRIQQGVRSGELTRDEVKTLSAEQRAIRHEERQYKSDGVLAKEERKDLQQDLSAAGKHIYQETHDAEKR